MKNRWSFNSKFSTLLLGLCVMLLMSYSNEAHKYYVSVTQLEYVEDQKSVQIINRVFIDDLERLFRERYDESITLAEKNESKTIDSYTEKYFKEKLTILIDGKVQELKFIGKEYEDDIIYTYFEIEGIEKINTMEISNEILFELFEEQQNIVRTKVYKKNKSFILLKENAKGVLNF